MSVSSVAVVLLLLCGAQHAGASQFQGTVITYDPKDTHADGTMTVVLRYKTAFASCSSSDTWECNSGPCGSDTLRGPYTVQATADWCQREGIMTRRVPINAEFYLVLRGSAWESNRNSIGNWNALAWVNLRTRSDTGKGNRTPQTTIIPSLRVPSNCGRSFNLLTFDPDGDRVQCHPRRTLPSVLSLSSNCILSFAATSSSNAGTYVVQLFVVDHPNQSITVTNTGGSQYTYTTGNYLSYIPLQFAVDVYGSVPSCTEGRYLPRFLPPTPANRARLYTHVGHTLEITINTQATQATVSQLLFSGPHNMILTVPAQGQFILRWTASQSEVGEHHPVCFVAQTNSADKYQSELRCVIVSVSNATTMAPTTTEPLSLKANVICDETAMTVEVNKSSFRGLEGHLRLNDPSNVACSLESQQNSTHIIAVIPLSGCGTEIEEDDENLIFKNAITTVDNTSDVITRTHLLEVEVYCQYPKTGNVTLSYSVHRNNVTVQEKGFGTFTFQFEFFHSQSFTSMMDPRSYPLEYDIGDKIYMQIEASSSLNNTELFVVSCRAAPYDNPSYQPAYSIIEHGCTVDHTVEVLSPRHERHFQFSMEAFKFIGSHDQVYISCYVMLCEAGNPNARCSKGCINSTQSGANHRRKREAVIQTARHYISQGPLRLRRSSEITVFSSATSLNLNLVFVAGCLSQWSP